MNKGKKRLKEKGRDMGRGDGSYRRAWNCENVLNES